MSSFVVTLVNYSFFPISLAGTLWLLNLILQTDLLESELSPAGKNDSKAMLNFNLFAVLISLSGGLWISLVLHLSVIGISHASNYPFPGLAVFLIFFSLCSILSLGVLPVLSSLLLNGLILGLLETLIGFFASIGFFHLSEPQVNLSSQVPFLPIAVFGLIFGIGIRSLFYLYKGV